MASASAQPAALSAEQAKGEAPSLGVGRFLGGRAQYYSFLLHVGPLPIRAKGWEEKLIGLFAGLGPLIACLFPPLGSPSALRGPPGDAFVSQWSWRR